MTFTNYFDAVDWGELIREYPIGAEFERRIARLDRDQLHELQNARFLQLMKRGWEVPFYRKLWTGKGIEPGDIRSIRDIVHLPTYSKSDLMKSVEEFPPFGDFHGLEGFRTPDGGRPPVIFHTTSGTTGTPQPLFFGPKSRELQNVMLARAYSVMGLTSSDVVQSVYGFGTVNAGHYIREAITHFTGALLLTTGTGAETRSQTQVEMMRRFGVTVLVGFADYLRKLAEVAEEAGISPKHDLRVRAVFSHLGGESRERMSEAWGGAQVCDHYGVGDTGLMAAEKPGTSGMYLWEDAYFVELLDPESGKPVADGEIGDICSTVLFKDDVYPVIRFNTHDLSAIDTSKTDSDWTLRRLRAFLGRSDNMVKLRGINIYPTAIGEIVRQLPRANGEFLCRVTRAGTRDELTVAIETDAPTADRAGLADEYRNTFRQRVGVELQVELVTPGALSSETGIETRQKPVRLVNERKR